MKMVVSCVIALALAAAGARADEQAWELRGEFVALKPGESDVAVLRLADGRSIEVPLESLAPASQAAARRAAAEMSVPDSGVDVPVTVRGPFGRVVRVPVPESIKDIEADAIHCRSAAEAADVYRLALAADRLAAEPRQAAEARLREWAEMADKGLVRLGDRWVAPAEARAAAEEAAKVVSHALGLMRLGSADLAEEELRKAMRIDPESERPQFVMALAYALVAKNPAKAVEQFADVARREPNAITLGNLAVTEIIVRRGAAAVEHFRAAAGQATELRTLVDNVAWAVRLAGDAKVNPALARNKMPDKAFDELNSLYRTLTQDRKIKPTEGLTGPQLLGPAGVPCTATTLADIAKLFESDARMAAPRFFLGFVVAPGHVVCPRRVLVQADGSLPDQIAVWSPGAPERPLPAVVVAAPADAGVALLRCDGIAIEPVPLAPTMPPQPEIIAVDRAGEPWLDGGLKAARGKVLTPAAQVQARGRFIHTAVVPRGPGGGPIFDARGRVVGMVTATPRTDASGNAAGFGLPVERISPLLKEHLPDVEAVANQPPDGKEASIESTVIVGVNAAAAAAPPR